MKIMMMMKMMMMKKIMMMIMLMIMMMIITLPSDFKFGIGTRYCYKFWFILVIFYFQVEN